MLKCTCDPLTFKKLQFWTPHKKKNYGKIFTNVAKLLRRHHMSQNRGPKSQLFIRYRAKRSYFRKDIGPK